MLTSNTPAKPDDERGAAANSAIPVVAIGASAGGLSALSAFFKHMPSDTGAAFVVIQHLKPDAESQLPQLLGRATQMPVAGIEDDTPIAANHVYVIPPSKGLAIRHGRLKLAATRSMSDHVPAPIDHFLRTLAEERRALAAAIVLSGAGSDGARGVKIIKDHGGIVLVQEPAEAEYGSMPRSAIATRQVDYALPIEKLCRTLTDYLEHVQDDSLSAASAPKAPQEGLFETIVHRIQQQTGRNINIYKPGMLKRRIARRMALHRVSSAQEYLELLESDAKEVRALYRDVLISVTDFFREPASYNALAEHILPRLLAARDPEQPVRLWVPGCATGEEAYSLAMLFSEAIESAKGAHPLQIFATDIDEDALGVARAGVYPATITETLSAERLRLFFNKTDDSYRVSSALRENIVFAVHDLVKDPPYSKLDFVSCRNLLIYLQPRVQERVMELFHFALNEGGYLFLGSAETVGNKDDLFEQVTKPRRIFRRLSGARPKHALFPAMPQASGAPDGATRAAPERRPSEVRRISEELLLREYVPASVLVNRKQEVVAAYGPTARYLALPQGETSFDLIEMAHRDIAGKLRATLLRAINNNDSVATRVRQAGAQSGHRLRISVRPIKKPHAEGMFLITFEDELVQSPEPARAEAGQQAAEQALADELEATKADLSRTIEELEAANEDLKGSNEEVLSMNEELQSANEELETSKEELQSLNEELSTVNTELRERVGEVERMHADLDNLFMATGIATLFLDKAFQIQRYTPAVKPLFNLIASDIGRPIADISRKFDDPHFIADIQAALDHLKRCEREIQTADGRWYNRRIIPYRSRADRIDGVTISFTDITSLKRYALELDRHQQQLDLAVSSAGGGLWDMPIDPDDRGTPGDRIYLSPQLKQLLGFSEEQMPDSLSAWQQRIVPEDREQLETIKTDYLAGQRDSYEVQYRIRHRDGRLRWFGTRGKLLNDARGKPSRFIGIITDITQAKQIEDSARQREMRLELTQLADALPVLIAFIDAAGRYVFTNAAYQEWFGRDSHYLAQRSQASAIGEAAYHKLKQYGESALAGHQVSFDTTLTHRKLGTRQVQVSYIPRLDRAGEVAGFYSLITDITERKRAESVTLEQQARMAHADRLATMGELATSIAHELNQPLGAISNYVSALIRKVKGGTSLAEITPILDKVAVQTQTSAQIVQRLRDFIGRRTVNLSEVDMNEAVRRALSLTEHLMQQHSVSVETTLAPALPCIEGDAIQLEQVIVNLITNAIDALDEREPAARIMALSSDSNGAYVCIVVHDNGKGIAANDLGRIFEAFHTTKSIGMGMGLAISHSIIEAHGGNIWAESNPGDGSQFTVCLPIDGGHAGATTPST